MIPPEIAIIAETLYEALNTGHWSDADDKSRQRFIDLAYRVQSRLREGKYIIQNFEANKNRTGEA